MGARPLQRTRLGAGLESGAKPRRSMGRTTRGFGVIWVSEAATVQDMAENWMKVSFNMIQRAAPHRRSTPQARALPR